METRSIEQIRRENEEKHRYELEYNLRKRFVLEYAFLDLADKEKEKIKNELLTKFEYDPDISMRENSWDARILYHQDYKAMSENRKVTEYFYNEILNGRQFNFKRDEWIKRIT